MVQSVATWSVASYGAPMVDGYQIRQDTLQRRAEPVDGAARFRRVLEDGIVVVNLSVVQTAAQFQAFESFVETTLSGGRDWFDIDLYVGTVERTLTAHLAGPYEFQIIGRGLQHARVRLELECFERESTAYDNPAPIFIYSGSPGALSTTEDFLLAGDPVSPSPADPIVWGGLDAGMGPPD